MTLNELASRVGGIILRGSPHLELTGMASLADAQSGDVSFLGNDKYLPQFRATRASAVLVAPGVDGGPAEMALIQVENPTLAFAEVVRHFAPPPRPFVAGIDARASVDPSAVLDPAAVRIHAGAVVMAGAAIGDGTEIFPNAVVGEQVQIGRDCRIMANVTIREGCRIGDRVVLQPGAVIGSDGYGYEFSNGRHVKIEQVGIVEIGDDVEIGSNTTIDRARFGRTVIGEGTKIDNLVQIGHNCVIGKHCLIVALCGISGSTRLGDYVTCAGQVGMVGHVRVGDRAVLSARSGVTSNLEGGIVYAGNPAQPMRDEMKVRALSRRLPKLVERLERIEQRLGDA